MPAQFGSDSTWLKGKHEGTDNIEYINLYQCSAIAKFNTNDYIITQGAIRFVMTDCVQVDDLVAIQPPEEE